MPAQTFIDCMSYLFFSVFTIPLIVLAALLDVFKTVEKATGEATACHRVPERSSTLAALGTRSDDRGLMCSSVPVSANSRKQRHILLKMYSQHNGDKVSRVEFQQNAGPNPAQCRW